MDQKKDNAEGSIVDFIDDTEYYEYRKDKQQVENGRWAIYIFSAVSFLFYIVYVLIYHAYFNWVSFAINVLIFVAYFCMATFSKDKPFSAFIGLFCIMGFVFLLEIVLFSQLNFKGIIIKAIIVVYLAMRLEAARKVQAYENRSQKNKLA